MWQLLCLVFIFLLQFVKGQDCQGYEETINNIKIEWPNVTYRIDNIVSEPPCVDRKNNLVTRSCLAGKFYPNEHGCISVQIEFQPKCLPDHKLYKDYCFYISEPQRWNPDTPVFQIEDILSSNIRRLLYDFDSSITKFWLPANRTEKYGKFVWTNPSKYLEKFSYYSHDHIPKYSPDFVFRDCMIVNHLTLQNQEVAVILQPEDCKQNHRTVHIYQPKNRYFVKHKSYYYSVVNNNAYFVVDTNCSTLAEPRTLEDNFLIKNLVGSRICKIGIQKDENGTYTWTSDNRALNHTDWISTTVLQNNFSSSKVVITQNGWTLGSYNCSVCQIDYTNYQVELKLKPSREPTELILTALSYQTMWEIIPRTEGLDDINIKPIYSNFSVDNNYNNIPNIYEKLDDRRIWRISFNNLAPNYYYFNAVKLPHKKLIRTEKIFLSPPEQKDFAYKVKIKKICNRISCDSQYKDNFNNITRYLYLQGNSQQAQFRAVKVKEIKNNWDIEILFHISTFTNGSIVEEYMETKNYLKQLNDVILELMVLKNETILHPESVTDDQKKYITRHKISIDYRYLKSCSGCLPESTYSETLGKRINWEFTRIGQTQTTLQKCLKKGEVYFSRKCGGNRLEGAKWDRPKVIFEKHNRISNYPTQFCDIYENSPNLTAVQIMNKLSNLTTNNFNLNALDIYYISEIFLNVSKSESVILENTEYIAENTSLLISNMLTANRSTYEELNIFTNATNFLLAEMEDFLPKITENDLDDQGIKRIIKKNFIHVNIDPLIKNITGIALFTPNIHEDYPFTEYRFEALTANSSVQTLVSLANLETAIFVPEKLLNHIKNKFGDKLRISINIFYNDSLFIENKNSTEKSKVISKVYSVVIKGCDSLYSHLPVISRLNKKLMTSQPCGYWDFGFEDKGAEWVHELNKDTEIHLDKNLQVCYYKHLTNFAMLLGQQVGQDISEEEHQSLELVTAIGCLLSTIGISGIFLTAFIFKSWRNKVGSKIILNVCFCILLQIVLLYLNLKNSDIICMITGTLLHYSVLCGFSWSLIMAVLQYLKFVKVIGVHTTHLLLKASIIGWVIPMIPVAIAVGVNYGIRGKYMPNLEKMGSNICYPQGKILYLTLLLPITLIVLINLVMFFIILYSISCRQKIRNTCSDRKMFIQQLKLAIFLFFLLGLTWISGLITMIFPSVQCLYLFSATASLQGFILFLFYVIFDPPTRSLWIKIIKSTEKIPKKSPQSQTQQESQSGRDMNDFSSTKESGISFPEAIGWKTKTQTDVKELNPHNMDLRKRDMKF